MHCNVTSRPQARAFALTAFSKHRAKFIRTGRLVSPAQRRALQSYKPATAHALAAYIHTLAATNATTNTCPARTPRSTHNLHLPLTLSPACGAPPPGTLSHFPPLPHRDHPRPDPFPPAAADTCESDRATTTTRGALPDTPAGLVMLLGVLLGMSHISTYSSPDPARRALAFRDLARQRLSGRSGQQQQRVKQPQQSARQPHTCRHVCECTFEASQDVFPGKCICPNVWGKQRNQHLRTSKRNSPHVSSAFADLYTGDGKRTCHASRLGTAVPVAGLRQPSRPAGVGNLQLPSGAFSWCAVLLRQTHFRAHTHTFTIHTHGCPRSALGPACPQIPPGGSTLPPQTHTPSSPRAPLRTAAAPPARRAPW